MKGPLRRIRFHRRPSDPAPQDTQPTIVTPAEGAAPSEPRPAGLAPEDVAPGRPSFHDRGRLRRRLRYLRRVRELGFRDLGGLVFDLHRFERRNDELVLGKLAAMDAVDRELRAIERVLDERRDIIELREPGVAACPRCGALHGSDARFCPQCGTQFSGPLAIAGAAGDLGPAAAHAAPAEPAAPEPTAAAAPQVTAPTSAEGPTPVSGALAATPAAPDSEQPPAGDEPARADTPTDQSTVSMPPVSAPDDVADGEQTEPAPEARAVAGGEGPARDRPQP